MKKNSYSKKPRNVYYNVANNGTISYVGEKKPERVEDKGCVWHCYFEGKSGPIYCKVADGNYYAICVKNDDESYTKVTSSRYHYDGCKYYYSSDGTNYNELSIPIEYYTSSTDEDSKVAWPNSANELPQIPYNDVVYYLDPFITSGAHYVSNKFSPMDDDKKEGTPNKTFGDCLMEEINSSVSIDSFDYDVLAIPEYVRGNDFKSEYTVEAISYTLPADYLSLYGKLFIQKLMEKFQNEGETIIKKYKNSTIGGRCGASEIDVTSVAEEDGKYISSLTVSSEKNA